ncbi:PREDICTED: uncharacterized protein LOC109213667 [Nicotiana attenuata]|uniref:uncharacterized protein LOC109213667 n=1 Tax=Nicotiana attenuata TaxID=49451 RepID=UPI0009047E99|nr:PREDICTED: uncharacterized protein LOC109213667 [Nicotiana attenuata]
MTNGTLDTSSTPTISRTAFHEDDYTHPCHPLYVHPSDVLRTSLVSTPFDGTGYGSWRRNVLVALSIRNKLDFINGNSQKPSPVSPLARQWQRFNDLVISWLVNSLSKEISHSVEYSEFAREIQNELEERYGKADGVEVFELKKESNILMMKPLPSIGAVYSIILSDEKQRNVSSGTQFPSTSASFSAGVFKQCYPSKVNFEPSKPSVTYKNCKTPGRTIDKCYKLHGYPPNFKFTRSPNLRKTAAHVELTSHAKFGTGDIFTEHGTLSQSEDMSDISGLTKDQYSQLTLLLQQSHLSPSPSTRSRDPSKSRAENSINPSKVNFEPSKPSVTCKNCKKPGHTIDKCYKLHGYPPNFKFTRSPNLRKTAAHVELTSHAESGTGDIFTEYGTLPQSEDMSDIPGLTKDQYSQLMLLLQQSHLSPSPSTRVQN